MIKEIFRKKLLKEIFILAIVVAILHKIALTYSLYWTINWFDIPMHFLGGLLIGILSIFFFFTSKWFLFTQEIRNNKSILFVTVASVLIVGLAWELWELFSGFTDLYTDQADTILDLIMDTIGAVTAFYYAKGKIQ